jgi:hypothetical protein
VTVSDITSLIDSTATTRTASEVRDEIAEMPSPSQVAAHLAS